MPKHSANAMALLDPATLAAAELDAINRDLERLDAQSRIAWALQHLPGAHALLSALGCASLPS